MPGLARSLGVLVLFFKGIVHGGEDGDSSHGDSYNEPGPGYNAFGSMMALGAMGKFGGGFGYGGGPMGGHGGGMGGYGGPMGGMGSYGGPMGGMGSYGGPMGGMGSYGGPMGGMGGYGASMGGMGGMGGYGAQMGGMGLGNYMGGGGNPMIAEAMFGQPSKVAGGMMHLGDGGVKSPLNFITNAAYQNNFGPMKHFGFGGFGGLDNPGAQEINEYRMKNGEDPIDPDDLDQDGEADHLTSTMHRIDDYLQKQYKLGKRKLTVSVKYRNIPLEYQYLQQYHGFPLPISGMPLAKEFGLPVGRPGKQLGPSVYGMKVAPGPYKGQSHGAYNQPNQQYGINPKGPAMYKTMVPPLAAGHNPAVPNPYYPPHAAHGPAAGHEASPQPPSHPHLPQPPHPHQGDGAVGQAPEQQQYRPPNQGPPPAHHGGSPPAHHGVPPPAHHGGPPPAHHGGPPPHHGGHSQPQPPLHHQPIGGPGQSSVTK